MFTTEQVVTIIVAVLGSSGVWAVINAILQRKMENRLKDQINQEANNHATLAILRQLIYDSCDKYIVRGCVTTTELKSLEELWEPYVEMNGNGTAKMMHDKVLKLPVVTDEEKLKRMDERFIENIKNASL